MHTHRRLTNHSVAVPQTCASGESSLIGVAALLADPSRTRILLTLIDGRALTAKELAFRAGVTAATMSGHLANLEASGLLARERQGRSHYFRLANDDVARFLETALAVTATAPLKALRTGPIDADLRYARCCWNHLAGTLGVALTDRLQAAADITRVGDEFERCARPRLLTKLIPDVTKAPLTGRACLDWSERRPHIGGALGRSIFEGMLQQDWITRTGSSRAVRLTPLGQSRLVGLLRQRHAQV